MVGVGAGPGPGPGLVAIWVGSGEGCTAVGEGGTPGSVGAGPGGTTGPGPAEFSHPPSREPNTVPLVAATQKPATAVSASIMKDLRDGSRLAMVSSRTPYHDRALHGRGERALRPLHQRLRSSEELRLLDRSAERYKRALPLGEARSSTGSCNEGCCEAIRQQRPGRRLLCPHPQACTLCSGAPSRPCTRRSS